MLAEQSHPQVVPLNTRFPALRPLHVTFGVTSATTLRRACRVLHAAVHCILPIRSVSWSSHRSLSSSRQLVIGVCVMRRLWGRFSPVRYQARRAVAIHVRWAVTINICRLILGAWLFELVMAAVSLCEYRMVRLAPSVNSAPRMHAIWCRAHHT